MIHEFAWYLHELTLPMAGLGGRAEALRARAQRRRQVRPHQRQRRAASLCAQSQEDLLITHEQANRQIMK
jgi:hypothetical protein